MAMEKSNTTPLGPTFQLGNSSSCVVPVSYLRLGTGLSGALGGRVVDRLATDGPCTTNTKVQRSTSNFIVS